MDFFDSHTFNLVVLPILIFLARICDVTMGTVRIIAVSRGRRIFASILGFFEVLIWITVISRVMRNMGNPICYIAYAGGFASGTYLGMLIEQRLAMGLLVVRVITQQDATPLIEAMHRRNFGVTSIPAQGRMGQVHLVFSVVNRSDLDEVLAIIRSFNPNAFYSVEDVRFASEGVFPARGSAFRSQFLGLFARRKTR